MVRKSGLHRLEGRRPDQLRNFTVEKNVNRYAEGSCLVRLGHTHVLCLASVEEKVPEWRMVKGLGWVTAEYAMLPRATHTRVPRESVKGKVSGRTQEISRLVGRALRAVTDFKLLGPRTISVDCEVLQADGSTRCAAISGAYVALALACQNLLDRRLLEAWPLKEKVGAVSVGIVQGGTCLDLCYEEDSQAEVDMNVVMTGGGKFIELQGTAEMEPFSKAQLQKLLGLAQTGMEEVFKVQEKILKGVGQ